MKTVLAALMVLLSFAAYAQPAHKLPDNAPVKSELDRVFSSLSDQLKEADALVARLRTTAQKNPEFTKAEIENAAQTLSGLADRLTPEGELAQQLQAVRSAAEVHRSRVVGLKEIEEADRTTIVNSWDAVIQDADKAKASMSTMRDQLMAALSKLRMRQTAISELLLAGQYKEAVAALKSWLTDLEATVKSLHKAIDAPKVS